MPISLINSDQIIQNLLEHMLRTHGFSRINKHNMPESFALSEDRPSCIIVDQNYLMEEDQAIIKKLNKSKRKTLMIVLQHKHIIDNPDLNSSNITINRIDVGFETGHNIHVLIKKFIRQKYCINS
jgi:DNA-binding NtrC family response regulator